MPMSPRLLRPRAAVSTAFDPRAISGLALWLDANDTATLGNTSTSAGGASNNGPVKWWGDKSGNSRQATNAGADSVCPTLLTGVVNGRNALGFDGGDSISGSMSLTLTAQTTFVVARMTATAEEFTRLFTQSDSGADFLSTGHYIPILRNSNTNALASWSGGGVRSSVSVSLDTWFVFCSRHTGSQIGNSLNGAAETVTAGQTLNKAFTQYRIGSALPSTYSAFFRDRVAETLVFSRSLSGDEKLTIERYLGQKYGITVA